MKTWIVIHHSATKDGKTFSWGAIRDYHVKIKKWADIGYHWGIERIDNRVWVVMGRFPDETGAHCAQGMMNTRSFGICLVGNFDDMPPDDELLNSLRGLVRWLMRVQNIPAERVLGHQEVQEMFNVPENEQKTCPGKSFDMNKFRASL